MPSGENLTPEHQKAAALKHGTHRLRSKDLAEWPVDKQQMVGELTADLEYPDRLALIERRRAAMGIVVCEAVEQYLMKEIEGGASIADVVILLQWPRFQGVALRGLKQVAGRHVGRGGSPKNVTEMLDELVKDGD